MEGLNNLAVFVWAMAAVGAAYVAALYMDYNLNRVKKSVTKKMRKGTRKNLTRIKTRQSDKNIRKKKKNVL